MVRSSLLVLEPELRTQPPRLVEASAAVTSATGTGRIRFCPFTPTWWITRVDAERQRRRTERLRTMYHLMNNLPVFGTLGAVALLAGPLARLPIDLGAWLLEILARRMCGTKSRH